MMDMRAVRPLHLVPLLAIVVVIFQDLVMCACLSVTMAMVHGWYLNPHGEIITLERHIIYKQMVTTDMVIIIFRDIYTILLLVAVLYPQLLQAGHGNQG